MNYSYQAFHLGQRLCSIVLSNRGTCITHGWHVHLSHTVTVVSVPFALLLLRFAHYIDEHVSDSVSWLWAVLATVFSTSPTTYVFTLPLLSTTDVSSLLLIEMIHPPAIDRTPLRRHQCFKKHELLVLHQSYRQDPHPSMDVLHTLGNSTEGLRRESSGRLICSTESLQC